MRKYDLVVVGGGNAFRVAHDLAKAGRKVALVEKDRLGGTCPNRGCIPSKRLLHPARQAIRIAENASPGFEIAPPRIDVPKVIAHALERTARTDEKMAEKLPEGATLYRGAAHFVDERTLEVDGERIQGERIVLGVGARPMLPDFVDPSLDGVWTSEDVFRAEDFPDFVTVVGGGLIGVEMATLFHGLGARTSLVHEHDLLLDGEERDVREVVTGRFWRRHRLHLGTSVTGLEVNDEGLVVRIGEDATEPARVVLFATGRRPQTAGLGLENTGVQVEESGHVVVDEGLETTAPGIFALGDAVKGSPFTHAAVAQASYLVQRLRDGADGPHDPGVLGHAVFGEPVVAAFGKTSAELEEEGTAFVTGRARYEDHPLGALVDAPPTDAFFCLHAAPDGSLLGGHAVGPEADLLLHEVLTVARAGRGLEGLTETVHVHPSLAEIVVAAAHDAAGQLPAR